MGCSVQFKETAKNEERSWKMEEQVRLLEYRPISIQTQKRIERALHQRLFLVQRTRESADLEVYKVLGFTGNCYTVTISDLVGCDCPDAAISKNVCKHQLFVMLKVLRVPPNNPVIWQVALLKSELRHIFTCAPPDPRTEPRTLEGDCPICYTQLQDGATTHCLECRNAIHKDCFATWNRMCATWSRNTTCIYCRADWNS